MVGYWSVWYSAMIEPKAILGSSGQANFIERLRRVVQSLKILPGRGYRVKQTTDGIQLEIDILGGGSPIASTVAIQEMQITEIGGASLWDYFVAQKIASASPDGTDVNVAKAYTHRPSNTPQTVDGVSVDLTYSDDNTRTADDGSNTQIEVSYPRYREGDRIFACRVSNGTSDPDAPTWLDITARVWARRKHQT